MAARIVAGAVVLMAITLVTGWLVTAWSPSAVDSQAMLAVAGWRTPGLTQAALIVSAMGDLRVLGPVVAIAGVAAWRWPWLRSVVWLSAGAIVGALLVTGSVKVLVGRERPLDAVVDEWSPAFPSGHTSRAVALCAVVVWVALRTERLAGWGRIVVVVTAVVGAAVMGASRVYLGVHWPSDVAGGAVVGIGWVAVLAWALHGRPIGGVGAEAPEEPVGHDR